MILCRTHEGLQYHEGQLGSERDIARCGRETMPAIHGLRHYDDAYLFDTERTRKMSRR